MRLSPSAALAHAIASHLRPHGSKDVPRLPQRTLPRDIVVHQGTVSSVRRCEPRVRLASRTDRFDDSHGPQALRIQAMDAALDVPASSRDFRRKVVKTFKAMPIDDVTSTEATRGQPRDPRRRTSETSRSLSGFAVVGSHSGVQGKVTTTSPARTMTNRSQ